ncbi:MAG: hypothetical protein Q9P14_14805 [candidate division KSB1 bacterium]|nr:hypothetical protein [candidate division KSB1 bacterium]
MAYVHVAHDCIIGDHVILANAVNLAGHVKIEDWGQHWRHDSGAPDFVRIGCQRLSAVATACPRISRRTFWPAASRCSFPG